MLLMLHSCATMQASAPMVSMAMMDRADRLGFDRDALELGRHVFVTGCARCHSSVRVEGHSARQWETILADMIPKTKLNAEEAEAVRAYVLSAHAQHVADAALRMGHSRPSEQAR